MEDAPVAPAFRSDGRALAFALSVLVLLALPKLLSALGLYGRRTGYAEPSAHDGGYRYIAHEIFDGTEDLDLVIVGPSTVWMGVDTKVLEEDLSLEKGAPARVRTFGHNWPGVDVDYAMLRDLLARHHVDTVALSLPRIREPQESPHVHARHVVPFEDDPATVRGLSLLDRVEIYGEEVLGAPRHLVSLLRRDRPFTHPVAQNLGAKLQRRGYHEAGHFNPTAKSPEPIDVASMIYTPGSPTFQLEETPISAYQERFIQLTADLLREHHVRLIAFHVPWFKDRAERKATERFDWPTRLGLPGVLVGVAPRELFRGLDDKEIQSLYYDQHMNEAGARFFTEAIAPAFVEAYRRGR